MTNSELILLSLIAEKPCHGYEIERIIEERGMRNWTDLAFSSIYFILNKLVRDGMATSIDQPAAGRGPSKKVYSATETGLSALREGVKEGLANPEPNSKFFMFDVTSLPLLSKNEASRALKSHKKALEDRLVELENHPALNVPGFPLHVKAMFTYSIPLLVAELGWLDSFIQEVEKGDFENGKN